MATFEGLCRNPAKSKMSGSNWLQTDEAVDVIFCDLHAKKGVYSNPQAAKVEQCCKNAGSCLVARLKNVTLIIDCHVLFYCCPLPVPL